MNSTGVNLLNEIKILNEIKFCQNFKILKYIHRTKPRQQNCVEQQVKDARGI